MRGKALALPVVLLALTTAYGCTRTDDGSLTMADPLHVGRYLHRQPSPPATPPVRSGMQVFPVSPTALSAGTGRSRKPASIRKAKHRINAQAAPQQPVKPLACRDAIATGGRVHVVCE